MDGLAGWLAVEQSVSQSSRQAGRQAGRLASKPNLIVRDENEMLMCSRCLRNSIINVCGREAAALAPASAAAVGRSWRRKASSSSRYHATQPSLGIEKLTVCLKRWQDA